jgi:hypothetical protein
MNKPIVGLRWNLYERPANEVRYEIEFYDEEKGLWKWASTSFDRDGAIQLCQHLNSTQGKHRLMEVKKL